MFSAMGDLKGYPYRNPITNSKFRTPNLPFPMASHLFKRRITEMEQLSAPIPKEYLYLFIIHKFRNDALAKRWMAYPITGTQFRGVFLIVLMNTGSQCPNTPMALAFSSMGVSE